MSKYSVVLAIARGARFDTGRRIAIQIMARDPLDAAIRAEQSVDRDLGECEYAHAKSVHRIGAPAAIAMQMAA